MITRKLCVKPGDLVKMKLGSSGPGIVMALMDEHPRANETTFAPIRSSMKEPHARVFWHDVGCHEIVRVSSIEVME